MAIVCVQKKENPYVSVDKRFIQDKRLSLRSKGLLVYLFSLSGEPRIEVAELSDHFRDGPRAVNKALKELGELGYVRAEGYGKLGGLDTSLEYRVFEFPEKKGIADLRSSGLGVVGSVESRANRVLSPAVGEVGGRKGMLLTEKEMKCLVNSGLSAANEWQPLIKTNRKERTGASVLLRNQEALTHFLGDSLTALQLRVIRGVARELADKSCGWGCEVVLEEIKRGLLDRDLFSESGGDFHGKLKWIAQRIREGRWVRGSVSLGENALLEEAHRDLRFRYRDLGQERDHLRQLLRGLKGEGDEKLRSSLNQQLKACEKQLGHLMEERQLLEKTVEKKEKLTNGGVPDPAG